MSRWVPGSVMVLVGVLTGCAAPAPELTAAHLASIRDSVQQFLTLYRARTDSSDWESLLAFYDDGPQFRWVENGAVYARSKEDVRRAFAAIPPGMRVRTTYEDTEILPLAAGLAMVFTRFRTAMTDSSGAGFHFGGAISMTLQHQGAGWRILNGHTSSPVPRGR
jgi:hypothetical protein